MGGTLRATLLQRKPLGAALVPFARVSAPSELWSRLAERANNPRVGAVLGGCFVALAAWQAGCAPVWDGDIWWIVRAGDDLLREGAVPHVNRYSFTSPAHPWVMHEWLYGAAAASLVRALGVAGLALGRAVAVLLLVAALLRRVARDARPGLAALSVALAFLAFGARWESPRPVGMLLGAALWAVALAFDERFTTRHALAYAALTALWTNLHGSYPVALLIAGCALFEPTGDRRARRLALLLAVVATFANPYGAALHDLVRRYLLGASDDSVALVHDRIREWWPLWRSPLRVVSTPLELVVGAPLALASLSLLRDRRWRPRGVLLAVLLAMALRHNRHLQLFGLCALSLLAAPVEAWVAAVVARGPSSTGWARRLVVVFAVIAALSWSVARGQRRPGDWVDPTHDDEDVASLLAAAPAGTRMFVTLFFTGYAVERAYPRVRVFFDTRNDCYPAEVLRAGFDLDAGKLSAAEADAVLRQWGVTHALIGCESRAARGFAGWRTVRRTGRFCSLER